MTMTYPDPSAKVGQETLDTTIHYLEMTDDPRLGIGIPPARGLRLQHLARPSLRLYRQTYDRVGAPWLWWERKVMADEEVESIIHSPEVEVHVVYLGREAIGFGELDLRLKGEVELVHLGLVEEHLGKGWGRWLLKEMLRQAWSAKPERVWLHTCNLDHPKALAFYQRAGFSIYKTEQETIQDPSSFYRERSW